ncbi:MAG: Zn-ribbon domain-containing OB-fold protein [Dehalococcoidia bacterium]|nr:Zn-ribbon domain-containing OB-fold protein [Dehalococcoidia bacterium]
MTMRPRNRVKLPETETGTILFNLDPIIIKDHYEIDYIHSYAQDSPFFEGLSKGELKGSKCTNCNYTYATPRGHCMYCGKPTQWIVLPNQGAIHTFTTCYYASEMFMGETPYTLILVEFAGVDTLFMSRLIGAEPSEVRIGMNVQAQYLRNSKFRVTDVYFVLEEQR